MHLLWPILLLTWHKCLKFNCIEKNVLKINVSVDLSDGKNCCVEEVHALIMSNNFRTVIYH